MNRHLIRLSDENEKKQQNKYWKPFFKYFDETRENHFMESLTRPRTIKPSAIKLVIKAPQKKSQLQLDADAHRLASVPELWDIILGS